MNGQKATYDVTVRDQHGNVFKQLWSVSADELAEIQEDYEDEPGFTVVADLVP